MSAPKPRRRTVTLTFDGLTSDEFYDGLSGLVRILEDVAQVEDNDFIRHMVSVGSYNAAYTPDFGDRPVLYAANHFGTTGERER